MTRNSEEDAWSEGDSRVYRKIASVAVPGREEQIATVLTVLPFDRLEPIRVVELGSGPGTLAHALLTCYPKATLLALDGSESMRSHAKSRLASFGTRFQSSSFELSRSAWYTHLDGVDAVVSSLCLHHLSGEEKNRLFALISDKTSPRGSLLIADLIEPQTTGAKELFASSWDRDVQQRSLGTPELWTQFLTEEWNYYRFPDAADRPSALASQLDWLREAGFRIVDCFWLRAGHAIFGGFKQDVPAGGSRVEFAEALHHAEAACRATT